MSYSAAWALQTRLHRYCVEGLGQEAVLILEHQPVYTLGRSAHPSHWGGNESWLRSTGADVQTANRGGSVTYHGPGQIVVYPIVKLLNYAPGPRRLVELLENVIIRVLGRWGIVGHRTEKKPGLWVTGSAAGKIASIGIRVERGVTLHGFALNVDLDLAPFTRILPCGLTDGTMTSMAAILHTSPSVQAVKAEVGAVFRETFGGNWATIDVATFQDEETRTYART